MNSESSSADASFWHGLSKRKLGEYKLDDTAQKIVGAYRTGSRPEIPMRLLVGADSFEVATTELSYNSYLSHGTLINANTLEAFKAIGECAIP